MSHHHKTSHSEGARLHQLVSSVDSKIAISDPSVQAGQIPTPYKSQTGGVDSKQSLPVLQIALALAVAYFVFMK